MKKLRVGILGATGAVGQQFLAPLENHPWFEVTALAASQKSAGKNYGEAVNWFLEKPLSGHFYEMPVQACKPDLECDFVFSGLDSTVAEEIEWEFARHGFPVISNAKNYRTDPLVPLLIPEINPGHIQIIPNQQEKYGFGNGFIVTNPNCATVGLTLAVYPLWRETGIQSMVVTTLQAVSGAGYPGVASLDILGNVVPAISGEAEKIQTEPLKIFATIKDKEFSPAQIKISAQCNRVPVRNGHLISVSAKLHETASLEEIQSIYENFLSPLKKWNLPSAPRRPVRLTTNPLRPQPNLDVNLSDGMVVTVGQLRTCPVLDVRLTALLHNTIRGAAGSAILNAEWLKVNGILKPKG